MAPPRGSSMQGGGRRSQTVGSVRSSVRQSTRSSILSNVFDESSTEDEPESEAESSVDEHRRKDTEYHERIQKARLKVAEERRAREKRERELEKEKIAARLAEKKKGAVDDPSSVSESDVDNANEVRRSPRKARPQTEVQQVESKLLSKMKRFSQLPKEIWEKRVKRKSQPASQPEPEGEIGTPTPASQSHTSSDGSKENVEEMETPPPPIADEENAVATHSSKAKRVSTAGSNPVRASPRKKQQENQNEDQRGRGDDSFVNKAVLTSTPYPGGVVAWKNGPSLPDPDMSPVTPKNKNDRVSRQVINTQKVKTHSQPQSRIPIPLPVKLSDIPTPSGSIGTPSAEVPSEHQKDAELADNEETPSSPRRSPRKSAAPQPTAQRNGTFNVTHGFGGGTARPKIVRTPVSRQSQESKQAATRSTSPDQSPLNPRDAPSSPSPRQSPLNQRDAPSSPSPRQSPLNQRDAPSSPSPRQLPLTQGEVPSSPKSVSEIEEVVDEPPKKFFETKEAPVAKTRALRSKLKTKATPKVTVTAPKRGRPRKRNSRAPSPGLITPSAESPSEHQKNAELADNEETPSSPRRSPRKSAAPQPTAQTNGTFNVTNGFGGGTARTKIVRTPVNRQSQESKQAATRSPSPDQSPLNPRDAPSSPLPLPSPLNQRAASSPSPSQSPLTQREVPSSPKSVSEIEEVVDEPPKKFFKTKKASVAKTRALPSKLKTKAKPKVTLRAPKRGRPPKQKTRAPSPVPQESSSSDEELIHEPSSQKSPRSRAGPLSGTTTSLPEPFHRGRPISASPTKPESPRRGSPSSASQPIPDSHQRSRISIQQTSKLLPSSQPLPGTSAAAASRLMTSQSSLSQPMRTKEHRRRSMFEIARATEASSSPPRKKTKKKVEKTPERYVGSDVFGNYHMLKDPEFLKILAEEKPEHGLDKKQLGQLGLRINHFLEDFFTQHCEETPQPYGFIPFGALKTALDEQCLVKEDCSVDDLLQEMKTVFSKENWKRSEGILYPSRYSKGQDNDDYFLK